MPKVLFIHHSTGWNMLHQGHLRHLLKKINPHIQFWDHSYNLSKFLPSLLAQFTDYKGLSDNQGKLTYTDYNIVLSNNSPKEYAEIFSRKPEDSTLKAILNYDIIAFKNCFPTTKIISDHQLEQNKQYYQIIRDNLAKYPNKKFIIFTPPPLRPELTKPAYANRSKSLVAWMTSKNFINQETNVFIFDFFNLLADKNGMLKKEFTRTFPFDSHPNRKANQVTAPVFAKFLNEIVKR